MFRLTSRRRSPSTLNWRSTPRFSGEMSPPAIRATNQLPLPLLVLGNDADDHHHAGTLDDLAALAAGLHGCGNLHLILYVMRPRVRSYGLSSTRTVSPGRMRMKFWRSFPEMCASTSCPFSSRTLNIAFGRGRTTSPSTSIASFFAKRHAPSFSFDQMGMVDTRKGRRSPATANGQ